MALQSHVDPCSFVVFIHVSGAELDDAFANQLKGFRPEQGDPSADLLAQLPLRNQQIRFHEEYHYWQGLRLPFVHRYATLAVRVVLQAFRRLAATGTDHRSWDCYLPELARLSLEERVGRYDGHLVLAGHDAKFPDDVEDELSLRPLDLLECATSLAEFQVTATGDKADPAVLHRWAKRNPAYLAPYEFASHFLGDPALALRCALPLINATFHTSEPVRTYVELLARTWGAFATRDRAAAAFLEQPEPCRWSELFARWLGELPYDGGPNADAKILGSPYHRVTLDWAGARMGDSEAGFLIHPFLGVPALRWIEGEKANPEHRLLMDQPAWVRHETFWKCRDEFAPTLTVYRFHFGGIEDKTFLTGTADGRAFTSFPLENPSAWRGFVADFLTMYGAVRRASGSHFDPKQRTCHQTSCSHYQDNFCNMYPIVPSDFASCGFPSRLRDLIGTIRG